MVQQKGTKLAPVRTFVANLSTRAVYLDFDDHVTVVMGDRPKLHSL
jgi:hypothetical protein